MSNILVVASEAVPFAKTGGLADVCGALPVELAKLGHKTSLIIPAYRHVYQSGEVIDSTDVRFDIPIGNKVVGGRLLRGRIPDSDVPVYLIEQEDYFNRDGLYGELGQDYRDNCERYIFFCRAVMEVVRQLELNLDVIHANDWQTGLIPAYLEIEYRGVPGFETTASIMTIHNMAYQGCFWHWDMLLTGLDWKYFNWHQMEFYGDLNLLKTGIVFADAITTVSPRYAREIQHAPFGCGLEGVLSQRRDVLTGIINGVDYAVWDPSRDSDIARNYDVTSWKEGKAACKSSLQAAVGLPVDAGVPLIGIVSRLVEQKGLDLITKVISSWVDTSPAQWVILGAGDTRYEEFLTSLSQAHPAKLATVIGFNPQLSHAIEAGADIFLMPSSFEPCGLNQLYSLKYGAVPVVHAVGGLVDTITDATTEALATGTANGFSFEEYAPGRLDSTLRRACDMWLHDPENWQKLVTTGMLQDWSWRESARQYSELYDEVSLRVKQAVCA